MNLHAVLLDLDGTLHDFAHSERTARHELSARLADRFRLDRQQLHATYRNICNRQLRVWTAQQRFCTDTARSLRAQVWAETLGRFDARLDAASVEQIADEHERVRLEHLTLYPDTLAFLAWARQRFPLALISNGARDTQRPQVDRLGLAGYFDLMLFEGELGVGKPDPRIFGQACDTLGCASEKAVMIGDSLEADVAGAQASGCGAIWLNRLGRESSDDAASGCSTAGDLHEVMAMLDPACSRDADATPGGAAR